MEKKCLYDLLYCDQSEAKELIEKYPDAIIKNASDEIHTERFSLEVTDTKEDYLFNVVDTGLAYASLTCQLAMMDKEQHPIMDKVIERIKYYKGFYNG